MKSQMPQPPRNLHATSTQPPRNLHAKPTRLEWPEVLILSDITSEAPFATSMTSTQTFF